MGTSSSSPSRLRRLAVSAGGSVTSQFVTAAGSLALQFIAVRFLGPSAFGAFALLTAVLVTVTSIYTSWVGDSLNVLDRFDPEIRSALATSILVFVSVSAVGGSAFALALRLTTPAGAVLFALLTALWLPQETCRRLLHARLDFNRLVLCDVTYVLVTLSVLGLASVPAGELRLETILAAMCAGSLASLVLVLRLLPREEYRLTRPRLGGMRALSAFAAWRSAQSSLRPLTLMATRVAIDVFASRTVLAAVEAGRLMMAPALTVIAGAGGYLLPTFVRQRDAGTPLRPRNALVASAVLIAGSLACGLLAVAATGLVGPVITGGAFALDAVTVGGWAAYAVSFSATLPLACMATAYRLSRLVFVVRAVETAVGVAAMLILLLLRPDLANLVPYCIGLGGIASGLLLWWHLRRLRNHAQHSTSHPEREPHAI
ncbi:hypothetical protein [Planobispora rosea]|uniref:hypothetical protein n=1 Tax=Planobispora rosea TaxID=35762 RepID=UPI0009FEEEC6|nr:hypothetical protein [Planobispora rosea]